MSGARLLPVLAVAAGCAAARPPIAVLVSATAEWNGVRARLADEPVHTSPYGEWMEHRFAPGGERVVLFHGGYGKIAAAGSTQYVIDRFRPRLVVNLGTCGGFGRGLRPGDVLLVNETVVYDIVEQMGDADETIADYTTRLDASLWPAPLAGRVRAEKILSGDRDLIAAELPRLREKYGAGAGDWESGAIAWVAAKNRTPAIILRGVTDVIDASGDVFYGNLGAFQAAAAAMMDKLLGLFAEALPSLR
ncbi:MAG TPA: 5'-methylthioadenosine/S-adenosylhomocysteine nucleosidase [Haliangiales bacterium]|nr:5'-methylthioadenosine/S-adenosylhomocysteine nucleosidase [Haliangiales bacterium]